MTAPLSAKAYFFAIHLLLVAVTVGGIWLGWYQVSHHQGAAAWLWAAGISFSTLVLQGGIFASMMAGPSEYTGAQAHSDPR